MSRVIKVMLLGMMCSALFLTGCGGTKDQNTADKSTAQSAKNKTTKLKLGICIWGTTDALARNSTKMVEHMVALDGGEYVVDTGYTSPETQIQSVENLIAAGCNAILVCNISDTLLPKLAKICEENQVYWGLMWRRPVDKDVAKYLAGTKYFVGNTCEDEIEIASRLTQRLVDSGAKKMAVISYTVGDTTSDMRNVGINQVCAKGQIKRVAEYCSGNNTAALVMEAVEKFFTGFPDLDAIFLVGGANSQLEGALAAIDKHGMRGKVKLVVIDFIEADKMKSFLNDGTLFSIAGGHYVDPIFTTSMLINAVEGNRLSDKPEQINLKFIDFKSESEAENYFKYVENDKDGIYAYNDAELKSMIKRLNPSLTMEQLKTMAANYSVADVMARHGNK